MIFTRKIIKNVRILEFCLIFAWKINKIRKFYMINARKIFYPDFFFGGGHMPPIAYVYARD